MHKKPTNRPKGTLYEYSFFYDISLNSSHNTKCRKQMLHIKSKHTFYIQNLCPKVMPFCSDVKKYGRDRQATNDNTMQHRKKFHLLPDS
jgi:hypothetical protein